MWEDYGRKDHKSFTGAAQTLLDDIDLSNMVIGWFKLFPPTSLVDPTLAAKLRDCKGFPVVKEKRTKMQRGGYSRSLIKELDMK